jgi:hypothetical protein
MFGHCSCPFELRQKYARHAAQVTGRRRNAASRAGDNLGPVRQVHLGGTLNGLEQADTSGLAVLPASCVTTTTEPGAGRGAELHHPGPRPGRRDWHPLATGQALLNPSAQLTDATDDMIVTKAQLSAKLAGSYPQVRPIVALDGGKGNGDGDSQPHRWGTRVSAR